MINASGCYHVLFNKSVRKGFRLFTCVISLFLYFNATAHAQQNVSIVYSSSSSIQRTVISEIERTVGKNESVTLKTYPLSQIGNDSTISSLSDSSLLVTLGVRSALRVGNFISDIPVLHTLLPSSSLQTILKGSKNQNLFGLHIDQPIERFFALIESALPKAKRIGVLGSDPSAESLRVLKDVAARFSYEINVSIVAEQSDLIPVLEHVIDENDVLLALPDSKIYNRYTIQKILLTTYKREIPVVAFSSALVRAGATMSVYSSPEQIGKEIGEIILKNASGKGQLPSRTSGPRHFSVAVNEQVSKSLGINIPSQEELHQLILNRTRREE